MPSSELLRRLPEVTLLQGVGFGRRPFGCSLEPWEGTAWPKLYA